LKRRPNKDPKQKAEIYSSQIEIVSRANTTQVY